MRRHTPEARGEGTSADTERCDALAAAESRTCRCTGIYVCVTATLLKPRVHDRARELCLDGRDTVRGVGGLDGDALECCRLPHLQIDAFQH